MVAQHPLKIAAAALALLLALAASPVRAAHFLWEVSSLTNRVYLYGTVHAGKRAWYPLPAPVEEAFADSRVLVVEADITNTSAMAKSTSAMAYPDGDELKNHVSKADYERFLKLLPRYGITVPQVARFKPFMAVTVLVFSEWGRLGYSAQYGVEGYLILKARAEAKPVEEIEGVEAQIALMDSLTEEENRTIFMGTLQALESDLTRGQIEGMVSSWQAGDPDRLLDIARKYNEAIPGAKEFEEKFVWSRHDAMVKKIQGYLDERRERHFIAVGALHLSGPRGLLELLKKKGYVVKRK